MGLVEINSHEFQVKPEISFCVFLQPQLAKKVQVQIGKELDLPRLCFSASDYDRKEQAREQAGSKYEFVPME